MSSRLGKIFEDQKLMAKIKQRLPHLFQLAGLESSRAGKIGMEVGSLRERVIVALLIYKFGDTNIETEIPITEPEVDANCTTSLSPLKQLQARDSVGLNSYGQLMRKRQNNSVKAIILIVIFCSSKLTGMLEEVFIIYLWKLKEDSSKR